MEQKPEEIIIDRTVAGGRESRQSGNELRLGTDGRVAGGKQRKDR